MNKQLKIFVSIIAALFIAGASLAYGAMTAPGRQTSTTPTASQAAKPTKAQLEEKLKLELPTITAVMVAAHPAIDTDYIVSTKHLFDEGQWFGATLTYKGSDVNNRDTLRVLLQKKAGIWVLRTTPPEPLLSIKKYKDVPKSILEAINKPISLPAGAENSPQINVNE